MQVYLLSNKNFLYKLGTHHLGTIEEEEDLVVLVDRRMNLNHQCDVVLRETNVILGVSGEVFAVDKY